MEDGQCVEELVVLDWVGRARVLLNFLKRRGFKSLLLAVDDLWLYNFHLQEYDGTVLMIFETIDFIEQKQWELVGLEEAKEKVEASVEVIQQYNPHSNRVYL